MSTKSYYDAGLVQHAHTRAASDEALKFELNQAIAAGAVVGAAVNNSDAGKYWSALADKIAPIALTLLGKPLPDGVEPVKEPESMLRDYCAIVNAAIKAAQAEAKRTAIKQLQTAKMADNAKKARDRLVKALARKLELMGIKVDWQACKAEAIPPKKDADPDPVADARKLTQKALSASMAGVKAELCALPLAELISLSSALAEAILAAQTVKAAEDADHKTEAAGDLAEKLGDPAHQKVDLVTVAQAEQAAEQAEAHLAACRKALAEASGKRAKEAAQDRVAEAAEALAEAQKQARALAEALAEAA